MQIEWWSKGKGNMSVDVLPFFVREFNASIIVRF